MGRSRWGSLERRGGSWEARFLDPVTQRPRRKVVGKVAELGEQLDDDARDRILARVRREVEGIIAPNQTFAQFLEHFERAYRAKVRPNTHDGTYRAMQAIAHMLPMPMAAVTVLVAEEVVGELAERRTPTGEPIGPNTLRLYVARLAALWAAAQRRGVVTANPWRQVEKPAARKRISPVKTAAELDTVYRIVPADLRPLVRVLAEFGLRVGEAAAVTVQDAVRAAQRGQHLLIRESKTDTRHVPVSTRGREALQDALGSVPRRVGRSPLLFPQIAGRGGQAHQLRRFHRALNRAGLEKMRFHDLRHCFGYRLARAGNSALFVSKVLGVTERTAQLYMDHNPQELADLAIRALDEHENESRQTGTA